VLLLASASARGQFTEFATRDGDKLIEGDREIRFISLNIPNLHYVEDYLPFAGTNPWRLPSQFEIRDALTAIRQIGGKVTRMYVLSVRRQDDEPGIIRHVEGPGKFNEAAFRALDTVLMVANQVGVRVIIPFVDNWKWWGGPAEYAAFRGKERDLFWTDPELIEDFKATVAFLVNRVNTCTGVAYKEDRAILAWETGNELVAPFSWTKEIAAYIKSLDENHLLIEGTHAKELSEEALDDPNIDIVSTHHYGDPAASLGFIMANQARARGKKPYVIGEYGIIPTQDIRAITDTIIRHGLAGGMVWSLRFRAREGGFYHHDEYNRVAAYRWPGFPNGESYDERMVLSILRDKAHEINGTLAPRLPVPEPPELLPTTSAARISWRGSTGARLYVVERKDADSAGWTMVADRVDESRTQYRPLFCDESAGFGKQYTYRVKAANESGTSEWSNEIGPIGVTTKVLVDEMESFDRVYQKDGALELLTSQGVRLAKEDRSRLAGPAGSYVIYKAPGRLTSIRVDAFRAPKGAAVRCAVDTAPGSFSDVRTRDTAYVFGKNDYGFYDAVTSTADSLPGTASLVKISLGEGIQIGRVEIEYEPQPGARKD
jgi:hypothetical protein